MNSIGSPNSAVEDLSTNPPFNPKCENRWVGRRVLIVGAARQGLALARFMARNGAHVTLNDFHDEKKIVDACRNVRDTLPGGSRGSVNWILGGHPFSLLDRIDLVCVSGGVPLDLPLLKEAQRKGAPTTNDSQIFMECVPCKVIGITGSAGKSTTTSLVGKMVQSAAEYENKPNHTSRVWVGGNIGVSLVDQVDQVMAEDLVVLEFSSFQLELMTISPQVSAILNLTPNHLDRHGTMKAYTSAKRRILDFQSKDDTAVLGRDDPGSWKLVPAVKGDLVSFGLSKPEDDRESGTFIDDGIIWLQSSGKRYSLMAIVDIQLRGEHNILNVLAAYAVIHAAGLISPEGPDSNLGALALAVKNFSGMPHRLELVRFWNGISWYNDSIATSPERTIAAIKSFNDPIVLLLGGRDKDLPWEKLSELVRERVDHVIIFGEAAEKIFTVLTSDNSGNIRYTLDRCTSLKEAVDKAANIARPGDIVLLSPGGTSFDEFVDFEERGERFREWIHLLP